MKELEKQEVSLGQVPSDKPVKELEGVKESADAKEDSEKEVAEKAEKKLKAVKKEQNKPQEKKLDIFEDNLRKIFASRPKSK
jgi:hypothetical protein